MQRKSSCSFTPLLRAASNRFCGECSQLSDGPRVSASKPQMPRERGSTIGWNKVEMRPSRTSSVSSCVAASSLRRRSVGESGRLSDMAGIERRPVSVIPWRITLMAKRGAVREAHRNTEAEPDTDVRQKRKECDEVDVPQERRPRAGGDPG